MEKNSIVLESPVEPLFQVGPWHVKEMVLTWDKIRELWQVMQQYKSLFSDLTRDNFNNFVGALVQRDSLWFEIWRGDELTGIVWLTDMSMIVDASAHMVFFDRQPSEKKPVIRELIKWVFDRYPLHRITVTAPEMYQATHRLLEGLGFTFEGSKVEAVLIGGLWNDVRIYGLTREGAKRCLASQVKPKRLRISPVTFKVCEKAWRHIWEARASRVSTQESLT